MKSSKIERLFILLASFTYTCSCLIDFHGKNFISFFKKITFFSQFHIDYTWKVDFYTNIFGVKLILFQGVKLILSINRFILEKWQWTFWFGVEYFTVIIFSRKNRGKEYAADKCIFPNWIVYEGKPIHTGAHWLLRAQFKFLMAIRETNIVDNFNAITM